MTEQNMINQVSKEEARPLKDKSPKLVSNILSFTILSFKMYEWFYWKIVFSW